jgi:hypothetical protein
MALAMASARRALAACRKNQPRRLHRQGLLVRLLLPPNRLLLIDLRRSVIGDGRVRFFAAQTLI